MYLEVAPAGGKWWRLKYRFEGKEKLISLGVYPEVGLKEATSRRTDIGGQVIRRYTRQPHSLLLHHSHIWQDRIDRAAPRGTPLPS